MTDRDFERIKAHFGEDSRISFPDFVSLRQNEVDALIDRVSSIADKGTLRRLYLSARKAPYHDESPAATRCPTTSHQLYGFSLTLDNVDGTANILEEHKGFKRFIKSKVDEYEIPGTIQRIPTTRVKLFFVTTEAKFKTFYRDVLLHYEKTGLFKISHESYTHKPYYLPAVPHSFDIIRNATHCVHDGSFSSDEYDNHNMKTSADYQAQGV